MSDAATPDQPASDPQPPAPTTPPAPQGGPPRGNAQSRPPQPGGPRPGGANRPFPGGGGSGGGGGRSPFPRSDRPQSAGGKPPSLDTRDFQAFKPNNRELDKMIEDELNQAIAGFDVTSTVTEPGKPQMTGPAAHSGTRGGKKKGAVVGIHGNDVFIDVPGGRGQGVLPMQQFGDAAPKVGDVVEFDIDRYDAANGLVMLTREGATQHVSDWSGIAYGMVVEVKVTGMNKAKTGLTVEVNGIKGFLPASQLDLYRVENLDQFVNQRLKVMVAEVVPEEKNLIVSRRAVLERERQVKAEEFWATVAEGQIKKGVVRSVKPFGAFVDLGGADGLLPVSEISWQRVNDPSDLFKIGDGVEVMITRVDKEARKVGLSLRALTRSPWEDFAERVKAGARVTGKVTRIADFGAFVELEPGVEGLIHVSELSTQHVRRVRDVLADGQVVDVEVLNVDPEARRIGLSLKSIMRGKEAEEHAANSAEADADRKAAAESQAARPVNPNLRGGIGGSATFFSTDG